MSQVFIYCISCSLILLSQSVTDLARGNAHGQERGTEDQDLGLERRSEDLALTVDTKIGDGQGHERDTVIKEGQGHGIESGGNIELTISKLYIYEYNIFYCCANGDQLVYQDYTVMIYAVS